LSHNGHYHIFRKNEDIPPYFTNRDKIFYKDGPSNDGFYGIWTWSATPNEKDPSKDYILSRYNTSLDVIEVVIISEAANLDDLVELLKAGIVYQPHSRRVMFSFYASKGRYIGILCNIKELKALNGKIVFTEDCIEVPVYAFTNGDILRLDNGLSFYRNAFSGLPSKIYQLKSPFDIVRSIVLSSISWTAYKARGLIHTEYRAFKDFLNEIPFESIINKIESTCHCSSSAANELLNEFLNEVWKYIDGNSLEDEIIRSAISASTELQDRIKALIHTDWEAENKSLLSGAQQKLNSIEAELKSATDRLTEAQEAFNKTKQDEEHIEGIIAKKKKLAEDVEILVTERIQKARENAAEFITNMAFFGGQPIQTAVAEVPATVEVSPQTIIPSYHTFSTFEDLNELEAHHSWKDVINTATYELGEAGTTEKYRNGLAAFLCAAYIEKQPILLVGPNAIDIAKAFCAAISGQKHGILCCEGGYNSQVIAEIGADGEDIVILNNLITSGWMNRLPEILVQKDIFYIATHPYAEDIQVEPKSLFGFMLPLFTEFFVDKKAIGKYYGGYFAEDFKPYTALKDARKELRILSKFALSSLVKNQINSLVATMHGIHSGTTTDDEFLFAVLPIAYASLQINELSEAIDDPQKGIAVSSNLKHDLQYILGEV